jgi:hypothetical protein
VAHQREANCADFGVGVWGFNPNWFLGFAAIAGTPRPLRGSGPGHKPAFDEAVALAGCAYN